MRENPPSVVRSVHCHALKRHHTLLYSSYAAFMMGLPCFYHLICVALHSAELKPTASHIRYVCQKAQIISSSKLQLLSAAAE